MTSLLQVPITVLELKEAIAQQDHSASLQLLKQLPLRKRWETLLLLQRAFSPRFNKEYARALAHDLLYRAYQAEVGGSHAESSRLYRLLIQHSPDQRITQKARDGYQRIATGQAFVKTPAILPTSQSLAQNEICLLIIEAIAPSQKQALALKFAQIIKTDPYTARLSLPSLEFRMLRHGPASEITPLHQALQAAGIPSHQIALSTIQTLPVYDVLYIEAVGDQLTVQIRDLEHPEHSRPMMVNWSEIGKRVDGLLPLFEEVIDRNQNGKMVRKTTTRDHAQICDLHLKNHRGIIRFYDAGYQFNQGLALVNRDQTAITLDAKTSWAQWQGLKQLLAEHLPGVSEHQKFEHFATSVVDQIEILPRIHAKINIHRKHECYWDQAFHLYSTLHDVIQRR